MADRPSISSTAAEVSREVIDFVQTRVRLLRSELKENLAAWKLAAAMGGVALVFLLTACLFLAVTMTCLIAVFLPTLVRWVIASIVTTVIFGGVGAFLASSALKRLRQSPLIPKKTLDVLRDDKNWLEGGGKAA
jgi:uncharacterized membrane protein YqjE